MKIAEILSRIDEERSIKSRYPLRVIFCSNLSDYDDLVRQLRGCCDLVINTGEFCAIEDSHPRLPNITKRIEQETGKQIALLSMGEYLRLAVRRETVSPENAQFDTFWRKQHSVSCTTRVYMPVFACHELFDRVIGKVDERQLPFLWELDGVSDGEYRLTVYSDVFVEALPEEIRKTGFKAWLLDWNELLKNRNASVVTKQFMDCENSSGPVSVSVVDNPYECLVEMHSAYQYISESDLTGNQWARLLQDTLENGSVEQAILAKLNMHAFDSLGLASKWHELNDTQRIYAWLWLQTHSADDYVSVVLGRMKPAELNSLASHIVNDILPYIKTNPEWVRQRRSIMQGLRNAAPSDQFFIALNQFEPDTILSVLTATTHEERAYSILTVCRLLRQSHGSYEKLESLSDDIRRVYPELHIYLQAPDSLYGGFSDYFSWYKRKKLLNRLVDQPLSHPEYDSLPTRFQLLAQYNDKQCKALWIDGLGIEWLSLLSSVLEERNDDSFRFTTEIACCRLPSETAFNEQWTSHTYPAVKRNRLDTLSHGGMPDDHDYFSCIAYQIETVCALAAEAISLLNDNEFVIITGDHGSSRLAALAFHTAGVYLPQGATAMAHGRYCLLKGSPRSEDMLDCVHHQVVEGKHYLVMRDYSHFQQSGNAAGGNTDETSAIGEIHGGMTPEECIVPVVVLKRNPVYSSITAEPFSYTLRARGGKASAEISFSSPVYDLDIMTSKGKCMCMRTTDTKKWELIFEELGSSGNVTLTLSVNNKVLPQKLTWEIYSGIGAGPMGGLP